MVTRSILQLIRLINFENSSVWSEFDFIPSEEEFSTTILATNLSAPHNIIYGPDHLLWITERNGKNITIINPDIGDAVNHLIAGGNYGWPYVAGFKDDNAYRFIN